MHAPLYQALVQDVAQEIEGNSAAAELMSGVLSSWLPLNFSPHNLRHPEHESGVRFPLAEGIGNSRNLIHSIYLT